jgi:putative photosynthetic complex assembly protein 2
MTNAVWAIAFSVFIWWFSTGIVLILNRLGRRQATISLCLSSLLGLTALYALAHSAKQTSTAATYCAFTSALLVWGWHELSFLSGWITGPRTTAIGPELQGWPRFMQAFRAVLWHELALLAVGALIVALTWHQPNQVGALTYAVLWLMRISAKLNLFLGVRNLSEAFLPPHLAYLQSFFRRRRMNPLLPVSVLLASLALVALVQAANAPGAAQHTSVGLALVGTLLFLGILEHALLVLPLNPTALWRWALQPNPNTAASPIEQANSLHTQAGPGLRTPDEQLLHAHFPAR